MPRDASPAQSKRHVFVPNTLTASLPSGPDASCGACGQRYDAAVHVLVDGTSTALSERQSAPVQGGKSGPAVTIAWDLHVRAWQVYAACGFGDQSAARIAERGGFGYGELVQLLAERNPWRRGTPITDQQRRRLDFLRSREAES